MTTTITAADVARARDTVAAFTRASQDLIDGIIQGLDALLDVVDDGEDTVTLSDNARGVHWKCSRRTGIAIDEED